LRYSLPAALSSVGFSGVVSSSLPHLLAILPQVFFVSGASSSGFIFSS